MKITLDTSALLKELQQYHTDAIRKMEFMVRSFSYKLTMRAIENTPLGDSDKFAKYYKARTYLPQEEGIARGNWQFSINDVFNLQLISGEASGNEALDHEKSQAMVYKLGDTFYIGNAAPYISALEADHSIQTSGKGIMQPTMDDITGAYSADFQYYYNRG